MAVDIREIRAAIEKRYQFLQTDNLLPPPTSDMLDLSVEDALAEINSAPPQTFLTLDEVWKGKDTRWKALLIIGTAKNVLQLQIVQWAANGFESPIDGLPIENKQSSYESAKSAIQEDFDSRLEKLKSTSQKAIRKAYPQRANPVTKPTFFINGRWMIK